MSSRLFATIFGEEAVSITVNGSPEQAARLLKERTRHWYRIGLMDAVVGSVAVDRVVLRRSRPFLRNSFAPIFRGRFTTWGGKTSLTGSFALPLSVRIVTTTWFCAIAVFSFSFLVIGASAGNSSGKTIWPGIFAGVFFSLAALALGFLGYLFVRSCRRLSSGDVGEIIDHVKAAIGEHGGQPPE